MSKGTGREKDPGEKKRADAQPSGETGPLEEENGQEILEVPDAGEETGEDHAARVGELSRENAELLDGLKRLKAEFENYRKRMLKEQTRILETAESDLVKKLLAVIDNLERAIENAAGNEGASGLREGVAMVLEQLLDILGKEGLEVIDPEGEPFDPEHHEAVLVVETEDCPEDTVIEVSQKGYRFNGKLLRPAMVKVSCPVRGPG